MRSLSAAIASPASPLTLRRRRACSMNRLVIAAVVTVRNAMPVIMTTTPTIRPNGEVGTTSP